MRRDPEPQPADAPRMKPGRQAGDLEQYHRELKVDRDLRRQTLAAIRYFNQCRRRRAMM
jgi:hypothetical protein